MANVFINITTNIGNALKGIDNLRTGVRNLGAEFQTLRKYTSDFNKQDWSFWKTLKIGDRAHLAGVSNLAAGFGKLGEAGSRATPIIKNFGNSLVNFNNVARITSSAARAVGTSMIFAGGAFRPLGVAINVTASLFQAFIPIISSFTRLFSNIAVQFPKAIPVLLAIGSTVAILAANVAVAVAQVGAMGVVLFEVAKAGIEFNTIMETTQISIATLTSQFKNLFDAQGQQIGVMKEYTDAQIKSMSESQRSATIKANEIAINQKLDASLTDAARAFNVLTVEAAQSPFTTQDLAKGFQAVVASLGRYNVSTDQAAQLTVSLGRVASVAGVSASNLASQFTLFLQGAGRVTSPLARFAAQIGLSKQKMLELRKELEAARDSPEKTAQIMAVLQFRLQAFDEAGKRVAQSWGGIMSNMEEAFQLFAGAVTLGLFTRVRNAFLEVNAAVDETGKQMVLVFDSSGKQIDKIVTEDAKKVADEYNNSTKKIEGSFAAVQQKTKGLLSEIFNYDEAGNLPTAIGRIGDVFNDKFQPIVLIVEDLFDIIGTDIAGALSSLGGLVDGLGDKYYENEEAVLRIYEIIKEVGIAIWDQVSGLAETLGISGELGNTAEWIRSIGTAIVVIVTTIRSVLAFVLATGQLIIGVLKAVYTIITGIVEASIAWGKNLWQIAKIILKITTGDFAGAIEDLQSFPGANFSWTVDGVNSTVDSFKSMASLAKETVTSWGDLGTYIRNTDNALKGVNTRMQEKRQNVAKYRDELAGLASASQLAIDKTGKIRKITEKAPLDENRESLLTAGQVRDLKDFQVERTRRSIAATGEDKVARTTPRGGSEADDDKDGKNRAKRIRAIAELAKSAYKEMRAVFSADIDFMAALATRTFNLVKDKIEAASDALQDSFERGEISFLALNNKTVQLTVAGFKAELQNLEQLEGFRQQQVQLKRQNLEDDARQETINFQNKLAQAQANKKSETEIHNLKVDHAYEQRKLAFQLAELERENNEAEVKHESDKERLQLKISEAVRKANQELFMQLKQAGRAAVQTLAELESRTGTSTRFQELQLEAEQADTLNALTKLRVDLEERLGTVATNKLSVDSDIITVSEIELKLLRDQEKAMVDLINLGKIQLRITQNQNEIAARKYEFDRLTEDIQKRASRGYLSDFQQIEAAADAAEAFQKETRAYYQNLLDIAAFLRKQGGLKNILQAQELEEAARQATLLNEVIDQSAVELRNSMRSGFATFFEDIQKDITSIGDAFIKLGQTILGTFQKLIAQRLSEQLFTNLFGGDPTDPKAKKGIFGDLFGRISQATGIGAKPRNPLILQPGDADAGAASVNLTQMGGPELAAFMNIVKKIQLTAEEVSVGADQSLTAIQSSVEEITGYFDELTTIMSNAIARMQALEQQVNDLGLKFVSDDPATASGSLSKLISRGEGSYGSFNRGKAGDSSGKTMNFANMTLGQIMSLQQSGKIFAVGKYQMIPSTLVGAVKSLGLKKDSKLTNDLQERIFSEYLLKVKRPLIEAFISGASNDLNGAVEALAAEFASVGSPSRGGRSRYAGRAGNAASITPAQAKQALLAERTRRLGSVQRNDGLTTGLMGSGVTPTVKTDKVVVNTPKAPEIVKASGISTATGLPTTTTATPVNQTGNVDLVGSANGLEVLTQLNTTIAGVKVDTATIVTNFTTLLSGFTTLNTAITGITSILTSIAGTLTLYLPQILVGVGQIVTALTASASSGYAEVLGATVGGGGDADYATGGYIRGPGTSKSDSIPAWLSDGEFVVQADAVKALGLERLHYINNAHKRRFKDGMPRFDIGGGWSAHTNPSAWWKKQIAPKGAGGAAGKGSGGFLGFLKSLFGGGGSTPTTQSGKNIAALKGGLAMAAITIGFALLGRLFAKKQPKSDPNRTPDPYGLNPETLTFYKKPIITGSRNYLRNGGLVTSSMLLGSMPKFREGGLANIDNIDRILSELEGGRSMEPQVNVNQKINITTPDLYSFRKNKASVERDIARFTQRGVRRNSPKY